MAVIGFDPTAFRAQYPAFADTNTYPDATLDGYFSFATNYISDTTYPWQCGGLSVNQQTMALNLLVAHLATIGQRIALYGTNAGPSAGFIKSSRVKDVAYELEAPKAKSAFGQWLSQTPYGQQLYAMLNIAGTGGFYVGGSVDIRAIRKGGGRF